MNAPIELDVVDPAAPADRLAPAIERACADVGFFRIPLGVVPPSVAGAAWETARAFFELPEERKRRVVFPEAGYPYGYSPFRYESLAASLGEESAGDPKESLSVGPDCLGPAPPFADPGEAWIRSPSLWPVDPPELRTAWTAFFRALSDVAARLLEVMAVALDLRPDHFVPLTDRHTSAMRALHYPALPAGVGPTALRAGAHSDYGTLTILRTDEVAGLEVRRPDGTWSAVPHVPDTLVVNLGDSIAQWTNDRWRSTVHRVTAADPAPRYSMAFFHMANWDATIECLPSCRSSALPPRHPPVQAGPWLMDKFKSTVT